MGGQVGQATPVIGVSIGGESVAYSVAYLSSREIVNDTVGGKPIVVTWRPLCQTGIVYACTVDTETLTFGVDGSLIYNSLVMYDRETNSRWSQFLGRAVDGPKQDAELSFVPSVIVSWGAWKSEHPDTLFLDTGSSRRPQDTYEEYYLDPDMVGVYGESNPDLRFDRKDIVLGVSLGDLARAYALGDLFRRKVINDNLGETSVAAVFDERSGLAAVFERTVADRSLTLRQGDEPLQMIDEGKQTRSGTSWTAKPPPAHSKASA